MQKGRKPFVLVSGPLIHCNYALQFEKVNFDMISDIALDKI